MLTFNCDMPEIEPPNDGTQYHYIAISNHGLWKKSETLLGAVKGATTKKNKGLLIAIHLVKLPIETEYLLNSTYLRPSHSVDFIPVAFEYMT